MDGNDSTWDKRCLVGVSVGPRWAVVPEAPVF